MDITNDLLRPFLASLRDRWPPQADLPPDIEPYSEEHAIWTAWSSMREMLPDLTFEEAKRICRESAP